MYGWKRMRSGFTKDKAGFTLIELVMVMTIIVVLATASVVAYQHLELKAKETILKQNLNDMRKMLDQYTADREELPQSLEDLVSAGYLREIPIDPITGEAAWDTETGEDPLAREGRDGIVDVRSKAGGAGSDGTPYSEY